MSPGFVPSPVDCGLEAVCFSSPALAQPSAGLGGNVNNSQERKEDGRACLLVWSSQKQEGQGLEINFHVHAEQPPSIVLMEGSVSPVPVHTGR